MPNEVVVRCESCATSDCREVFLGQLDANTRLDL